ncbi:unnamed protein product, partial [Sphagnum compactum]
RFLQRLSVEKPWRWHVALSFQQQQCRLSCKRFVMHHRQKKRLVLDEDDYVMLEEAGFHRPPRLDNNKKFKRLKKAGHITGEKGSGSIGLSDEEDGGVWQRHTAEEQLKRSLFGDDEGGAPDIREDEELEEEEEEE